MRKIKNSEKLAVTETRRVALEIIEAGLEAIDTKQIIQKSVKQEEERLLINEEVINIKNKNIYLCGVGKCALEAASALEEILNSKIKGGIVMGVQEGSLQYATYVKGTHPLPSEINICAANALLEFLSKRKENDLVLMVVSGGGSALLTCHKNLSCTDEGRITHTLFEAGATIQELNTLRKHLSSARGGNLAAAAYPAEVVSLIFSDVPGNTLDVIASGPTIKDPTTVDDAIKIIERYNLDRCCGVVKDCILETPKESKYFEKTKNILLLTNTNALAKMQDKAREHGWNAKVVSENITGEVSEVLDEIMFELREQLPGTILLYGGETTMTGNFIGKGGRNQELAMRAVEHIDEGEMVIAIASDGQDHSDSAGGIADSLTAKKAKEKNLDMREFLKKHNSYEFCQTTESAITTNDTGSNISDLILAIKEK